MAILWTGDSDFDAQPHDEHADLNYCPECLNDKHAGCLVRDCDCECLDRYEEES